MNLKELVKGVDIVSSAAEMEINVDSIVSDSRKAETGCMFICQKGTRKDGNDYVTDALEKGASVIVTDSEQNDLSQIPHIKVRDARLAEAVIWNNFYGDPSKDMKVIAVTGTNGKTSTVFMIRQILRKAGYCTGAITTVKAFIDDEELDIGGGSAVSDADAAMTTPDPEYLYKTISFMKESGVNALVFEASSHALFQRKIDPINIDVAVFTNLSEEHLDFHGTMENYFRAKARLAGMARSIVTNLDDEYMARLSCAESRGDNNKKIISCSADKSNKSFLTSSVTALRQNILGVEGVEYIYFSREAVFKVKSSIPGIFTIYNSMLAISASLEIGVKPDIAGEAIASLKGVDGRLERVELDDADYSVFIDYAHTSAALETILKTVREIRKPGQKITLLFGCGGDRDRSKRKKMGAIASRLADFVIVTSDNCRSEDPDLIIREILSGIDVEKPHAVIKDRKEAIEYGVREAARGEILILAGKGHEKYEINSDGKKPFDEKTIVISASKKRSLNKS